MICQKVMKMSETKPTHSYDHLIENLIQVKDLVTKQVHEGCSERGWSAIPHIRDSAVGFEAAATQVTNALHKAVEYVQAANPESAVAVLEKVEKAITEVTPHLLETERNFFTKKVPAFIDEACATMKRSDSPTISANLMVCRFDGPGFR